MAEFGKHIGVSIDVIKNMEYGKASHNKILIDHMCDVYNINPEYLETGKGEMFAKGKTLDEMLDRHGMTDFQKELIKEVMSLPPEMQQSFLNIMRNVSKEK